MQKQIKRTNYQIFLETVNMLKSSQGFYSRLARQLDEMDEDSKASLEQTLNSEPQWNDSVDCIMFLES